jgi:putative endonuclease
MKGYYVYILISKLDGKLYTGFTTDLNNRLSEHNNGKVTSTKKRIPLEIVYCEFCLCLEDAVHREKYLKTTYGKRFIKNRIKNYLSSLK